MEINELMVGDWVRVPSELNRYMRIRSTFDMDSAILYEPIPLTPEILEKNGFEDIGDDTYQLEEKPCWFWVDFFKHTYGCEYDTSTYEYEDDEHRLKLYGIPSVHELQHALRLCGIEKEIEL
jgi:hypothetical protein